MELKKCPFCGGAAKFDGDKSSDVSWAIDNAWIECTNCEVSTGTFWAQSDDKEDCDKAIKLDPNYAYAYLNRGNAKELMRDENGACQDWRKAVELGAEGARAYIGTCQ